MWIVLAALAGCPQPGVAPPGLVLIAIDNVRWDRTSLADPAGGQTPSLAEFAALPGSVSYTRAYAAAPFSLASYTSIFTALDAPRHGAGIARWTLDPRLTTLAEALSANGWQTAAFTGGAEVAKETGLDQGFDRFESPRTLSPLSAQAGPALRWLAQRDPERPWFLFVQGYEAHIPYLAPPFLAEAGDPDYGGRVHRLRHFFSPLGLNVVGGVWRGGRKGAPDGEAVEVPLGLSDIAHVAAHYDAAVRCADYALGTLLRDLDATGVLDTAVVVVLSDHGEDLGEDGSFGHGPDIHERLIRVPMVVHFPLDEVARRVDAVVSQVDLAPALLAYFGIAPLGGVDGVAWDFLTPPDRPARAASGPAWAVRDAEWLLLDNDREGWQLYRDGDGAEVAADNPQVVTRLAAAVEGWPERGARLGEPDDILKKSLREAGYFTPTGQR